MSWPCNYLYNNKEPPNWNKTHALNIYILNSQYISSGYYMSQKYKRYI